MGIIETIAGAAITGIGSGLGSAIGLWLAQRGLLKHLEKVENQIKRKK